MQDPKQHLERTSFQTGRAFDPRLDIKSDVAMVYGIQGDVVERIRSWRDRGYRVHLMTGVAWGEYQDYFSGQWDGRSHEDEAQTDRDGNPILHGPTVPYVAPSESYGEYLCGGVKRAIDAGAEAIHLEEPEFWVRGGYSGSFKREWQAYYGEPWIPPHLSPDAQYRASKLKCFLYRRALQQVFAFVLDYGKQIGREIPCYVPTHSMLNYAHWGIVSPEQSLVQLQGCDGYIGQVWTGTARTPNVYQGVLKERTFETAFFEYGVLHNLVRSTGRRMWFLNDPVEDNPNHSWEDYRRNWEGTLVASLLWPDVWRYEVTPWPERPFLFEYPVKDVSQRQPDEPVERVPIPPEYATEILTAFNALNDMEQRRVEWECGTQGLGVLVSDTMMFQRGAPNPSDPHLGSFYGLAMPLLKRGVPTHPVQYENIGLPEYLAPYRVLFLTYEGQKPPAPELHTHLAQWVRSGGVLVFVDDDRDPYNAAKEWWNRPPSAEYGSVGVGDGGGPAGPPPHPHTPIPPHESAGAGLPTAPRSYTAPRQHLFEELGIPTDATDGLRRVGKGAVLYRKVSPASLAKDAPGAETTVGLAREACKAAKMAWRETSAIVLRRGPYVIAAGLEEANGSAEQKLTGRFIDLFDPRLAVVREVTLLPGSRRLLVDLDQLHLNRPRVLASASRVLGVRIAANRVRFHSAGPEGTFAVTCLALPSAPRETRVGSLGRKEFRWTWDRTSKTVLLEYPNAPEGVWVDVTF